MHACPARAVHSWRSVLAFILLTALPGWLHAQTASSPVPASTNPGSPNFVVRTLSDYWAVAGRSVRRQMQMEMLVRYYDPAWKHVWCEVDGSNGFIPCQDALPIAPGDRVLLEGTVIAKDGLSGQDLKVTPLLHNVPQIPLKVDGQLGEFNRLKGQLVSGKFTFDSEKIDLDKRHLDLELIAEGYRVHLYEWSENPKLLGFKQGSLVQVSGVYNSNIDTQTARLEIDLWVANKADIVLLDGPENDARFKTPVSPIEAVKVAALESTPYFHTAGFVRQYEPGESLVIRESTGQVIVKSFQTLPLRIGDWVEVEGDAFVSGSDWWIKNATVRMPGKEALAARNKQLSTTADAVIRLTDQALAMNADEAARGLPVDLSGMVIWSNPKATFFYFRDTTGVIEVQVPANVGPPLIGLSMRLIGVTARGTFAPEINGISWEVWGSALLSEAQSISFDQALSGNFEGQRVQMSGHVQHVSQEKDWTWLTLSTPTGSFRFCTDRDDSLSDLFGSIILVKGVCHALANERRQLISIEILGSTHDSIRLQQAAPADPFALPLRDIGSLRQFHPSSTVNYWTSVEGTVTLQEVGHYLFLQDHSEGVMLLSEQLDPLQPGDKIRATGLPGWENGRVVLREAVFKKTGQHSQLTPENIPDPAILHEDLDSSLVTMKANLISTAFDGGGLTFSLQEAHRVFSAGLSNHEVSPQTAPWSPGSKLELTGVYQLVRDEHRQAVGFRLGLRSAADVRVLQNPSWWTPARAFTVTGFLVAFLAGGFLWVAILKRRVTRQTDQIRVQLAKEGKLEAHHRAIVSNANDFIFTTDMEGRFTSFNPAGEKLLGYPREEALEMNLRDLIPVEETLQRDSICATLSKLSQSAARFELRLVTKTGTRIWTEVSACLVQNAGEALGVLGVARDISERKQIEEELKRARDAAQATTEAKSAFLANMSHEIRTPMNGVIGMGNLLLDTPLNDEQREYAETIRNSAESLLTVLNDILDFSKIEAGKLHFEAQDFDLITSVEETLELLSVRAAAKKIELTLFIAPELPLFLRGDPGRLRQVLINLVGNAVKFTEQGEVAISVAPSVMANGEMEIRFEVSDTGLGIAEDDISRLFQPFSQADASTTRRFGGTGLGLAISRQIVQLMRGKIGVRSKIGVGSTFWFTAQFDAAEAKTTPKKIVPASLRGVRLLAVDDHETNCRIITAYTSAWGMRGEAVRDADQAVATLRAAAQTDDPFRIVLLDYQMPDKDGMSLAREIRADPSLAGIALIFLTSVDRRFTRDEIALLKLSGVLTKPIQTDELQLAMGKAISGSENLPASPTSERLTLRSPSPVAPTRSLRVLVAEDNVVNQRLVLLQLQKLGYRADISANGNEVLSALERSRYDVILMDCQMPEMDGYEASLTIRKDERFSDVKIIAMTANAMQGDREKCLEAGMNDYLTKPTRLDELQAALKKI